MKRLLLLFLAIAILIPAAIFVYYQINLSPVSDQKIPLQEFVINQGEGLSTISRRLERNGYVKNSFVFMANAYINGLNGKLQAGTFRLSPSQTTVEIVKLLSKGGSNDSWFKILEGMRLEEFTPSKEFEIQAKEYEGQLFPDTYLIPNTYTPAQTISLIRSRYEQKLAEAKTGSNSKLTDSENLTLASLIEREGRSLEAKQMIAGILLNRLTIGMPLQVDATVQYARDSKIPHPKDYWQPVVKTDLSIKSAYNTYQNPGLPPAPICNPGYNSLYAAYHPTDSDYLYYITGNDNKMHYAKTLEEHNSNINNYLK